MDNYNNLKEQLIAWQKRTKDAEEELERGDQRRVNASLTLALAKQMLQNSKKV